ncbi:SLACS reverse transcriptase [Strigomonas culicis]|nr:SLACS reverse transcriptase [Strigomonas culicis]EPY35004.1 SLACS reverse transcriptase [Strigomonas culicis]|eukprot:EPY33759.1 SLACS reverse transcriptase [Strigomonas culicis]
MQPAWPLVDLLLGQPARLGVYDGAAGGGDGARVLDMLSTRGIRQGMVLGPLLFALAMHGALAPLLPRLAAMGVDVVAYLDDVHLLGGEASVRAAVPLVCDALRGVGLVINTAKSVFMSKRAGTADVGGITQRVEQMRVLGAGLAADGVTSVGPWLLEQVRQHDAYFAKLRGSELPLHTVFVLLRASVLPRMTFLLRTHTPEELREAVRYFDAQVQRTLEAMAYQRALPPVAQLLAKIPMADGGLGLRSQEEMAAFTSACVGDSALQRSRTRAVDTQHLEALRQLLSQDTASQRVLRSNCSGGARRAFADPAMRVPDVPFRLALLQRLMIRVLPSDARCVCGEPATNHHVNTCARLGAARIYRHNAVLDALELWCRQIGYSTAKEVLRGDGSQRRIDLLVNSMTAHYATDVGVCYPGRRRATNPLQQMAEEKLSDWRDWSALTGKVFAPLVVSTTGELWGNTVRFIQQVTATRPNPYSAYTSRSELVGAIVREVLFGNTLLFATVDWTWQRWAGSRDSVPEARPGATGRGRAVPPPQPRRAHGSDLVGASAMADALEGFPIEAVGVC